jgi:general secretion pathway protein F
MPVYQYRGYKADGGAATGIVDAESPKVARLKLRKDGVFPTEMLEQEGATRGMTSRSEPVSGASLRHRSQILTVTDVALMTRQLATLLVAGLPLVDALGVLMDQTEKKNDQGADRGCPGSHSWRRLIQRRARALSPGLLSHLCPHGARW